MGLMASHVIGRKTPCNRIHQLHSITRRHLPPAKTNKPLQPVQKPMYWFACTLHVAAMFGSAKPQ
jgi:hypothetical protein